jgi:hypothetical protein
VNLQELTSWNRLLALDLDVADTELPFSARLARDNSWSADFARRAVEEYKKFCFLVVHAGHPATPSDEVDQVWHLHLLYSRHYWEALCRDTLETPLHHGPTAGGVAEDRKYQSWYEATLESYRRYFGEPPPDLWPAAGERFDARHDFTRIDRRDVVAVDRALLRRSAIAALLGGGALAIANALAQADGAAPAAGGGPWAVVFPVMFLLVIIILAVAARSRAKRTRRRSSRKGDGAVAAGATGGDGSSSKDMDVNGGGSVDGGAGGCGGAGGGGCGGGGS